MTEAVVCPACRARVPEMDGPTHAYMTSAPHGDVTVADAHRADTCADYLVVVDRWARSAWAAWAAWAEHHGVIRRLLVEYRVGTRA